MSSTIEVIEVIESSFNPSRILRCSFGRVFYVLAGKRYTVRHFAAISVTGLSWAECSTPSRTHTGHVTEQRGLGP
mgnify:CR=1 FL=1